MQAVSKEQHIENPTENHLTISAEIIAYAILITLAVILRFANLGTTPMTDGEAVQALPAYHTVNENAPGTPQPAQSVVIFWLQTVSFTIFGGTEFAARLPGVIAGVILILMPLFYRSRIGTEQTFLFSLILTFSPIAFTAARFADSSLWAIVFALGMLWALWQYWDEATLSNAIKLALWFAAMTFLSGAGGLLLLIILLFAGIATLAWTVLTAPDERNSVGDEIIETAFTFIRSLPVIPIFIAIIGLTVLTSTGFMLYPNGLNIVAESINHALQGFVRISEPNAPNIFAVLALIIYEPLLLILAIISAALMLTSQSDKFIDRFALAWAVIAFLLLLLYRGSLPAYALFMVVPLSFLTTRLINQLLVNYMPSFLSLDAYISDNPNDYGWIKWVVALIVFAGFIMLSLYLATLGRALLNYPGGTILFNFERETVLLYARVGWFFIMAILLVVLYFMFASMWGNRAVLQGYGLATFGFMLLMGIGTGWNTAVVNVNNPTEFWYTTGISADAYELRETLFEIARRESRGFPSIQLTILRDDGAGITGSGLMAWLVRDFTNAEFVDTMGDARQDEIVLLPQTDADPDLGGSYVGQSFVIREYWPRGQMLGLDWISWFTQRRTRPYILPEHTTVLWLRLDVYDGVPAIQRP